MAIENLLRYVSVKNKAESLEGASWFLVKVPYEIPVLCVTIQIENSISLLIRLDYVEWPIKN